MRLWEFDRLGGIASSSFDIHEDSLQFVSVMLGYLWMNDEQLGFDPTFTKVDGIQYVTITRNGQLERLIIVEMIKRENSVVGRGIYRRRQVETSLRHQRFVAVSRAPGRCVAARGHPKQGSS
jgi:Fungal protein kinase